MARPTSDAIWRHKRMARDIYGDWPDCPYCGAPFYWSDGEVDHIISYVVGGQNTDKNMVLVCKDCNHSKTGKWPREWMMEMGYSLNDCRNLLAEQAKTTEWLD